MSPESLGKQASCFCLWAGLQGGLVWDLTVILTPLRNSSHTGPKQRIAFKAEITTVVVCSLARLY